MTPATESAAFAAPEPVPANPVGLTPEPAAVEPGVVEPAVVEAESDLPSMDDLRSLAIELDDIDQVLLRLDDADDLAVEGDDDRIDLAGDPADRGSRWRSTGEMSLS